MANNTAAVGNVTTSILGVGLELLFLGVAAGVANTSDEVGNILLVFMIGILMIWLFHHTAITNAIPNLFNMLPNTTS